MTTSAMFPLSAIQDYAEVLGQFGNPEFSQHIQPLKLTRAERRLWLLESIRANLLCCAAQPEWTAMRGCSLPGDGIASTFTMCKEMRDSILEYVDKIRATYHTNWVTDQLGNLPPESGIWIHHKRGGLASQTEHRIGRNVEFLPPDFGYPTCPVRSDLAANVINCTGKVNSCGKLHFGKHVTQETTRYESVRSGQML